MVKLRVSKESELRKISEMEQQPHAIEFINRTEIDTHRANFVDQNIIYLSIENDKNQLAGYFILAIEADEKQVEFRRILIDQSERGIGQEAIGKMEEYCRDVLEAETIWLDVYADNLKGKHIYEKLGYQYLREDSCNGRKLLYYRKTL